MVTNSFDGKAAKIAAEALQPRIFAWISQLVDYDGYKEWKNKQILSTIIEGLTRTSDYEELQDFSFPDHIVIQHEIVSGYMKIQTALENVKQCEFYFRRFPFSGLPVTKLDHIKTCCELYFSRIYHFKVQYTSQLKRLDRKTKPKKTLPINVMEREYENRFKGVLDQRNKVHHEGPYDDLYLSSLGLSHTLAIGSSDFAIFDHEAQYRKLRDEWVKRVRVAVNHLDLYLGIVAKIMMDRCDFLGPSQANVL